MVEAAYVVWYTRQSKGWRGVHGKAVIDFADIAGACRERGARWNDSSNRGSRVLVLN